MQTPAPPHTVHSPLRFPSMCLRSSPSCMSSVGALRPDRLAFPCISIPGTPPRWGYDDRVGQVTSATLTSMARLLIEGRDGRASHRPFSGMLSDRLRELLPADCPVRFRGFRQRLSRAVDRGKVIDMTLVIMRDGRTKQFRRSRLCRPARPLDHSALCRGSIEEVRWQRG